MSSHRVPFRNHKLFALLNEVAPHDSCITITTRSLKQTVAPGLVPVPTTRCPGVLPPTFGECLVLASPVLFLATTGDQQTIKGYSLLAFNTAILPYPTNAVQFEVLLMILRVKSTNPQNLVYSHTNATLKPVFIYRV